MALERALCRDHLHGEGRTVGVRHITCAQKVVILQGFYQENALRRASPGPSRITRSYLSRGEFFR